MKRKGQKISQAFQLWLLALVTIAFLTSTAFLWFSQTKLSEDNTYNLLKLNISDVKQDVNDLSNENLLALTRRIAKDINHAEVVDSALLYALAEKYDAAEINYIDTQGIITASTFPGFIGYNMQSGTQSGAFMVLIDEQNEFVQSYQPISYDTSVYRKYAGVALRKGGFVQVGYDSASFQKDIAISVINSTRNRHIGEGGSIIIADEDFNIVSSRSGGIGKNLEYSGLDLTFVPQETLFTAIVHDVPCYCMYDVTEGFYIIAVMPQSEAVLSRNVSVGITTIMEVIIFAALFILIYFLIKRLIVNNIYRINDSLEQITGGNLDVVVDVRSHQEFASLSDDINTTVDTLKKYIADAAARIDAELAFAKAIQSSALPSVFPPYPNRKEFELWATMDTAKEVGGDFYDFYFVNEETLAFLIADVSGKGIPAAMFMMNAKAVLKSYAESGLPVNKVFTLGNENLCEGNNAGMFVTAWMGFLNTKTGMVTFANAGHNPPLVKHADGSFEYLKTRAGFVLAGMEGINYRQNELQLEPGAVIYLYTDGITEATNINNELYGEDRLLTLLNKNKDADMETLCALIKEDVFAFAGEAPQFDDITMLALKFKGNK